ncbi:MAG: hypothetical protein R3C49_11275 [Planctomycetaceae bacterium]
MAERHRVGFLTMDSLDEFVCYDHLVVDPLRRRAVDVEHVSWRQPGIRWDDFEMVVIRSPWDYQTAIEAFLQVLADIDASDAMLQNDLAIVRWNIDKRYLSDLQAAGVPVIPTDWLDRLDSSELQQLISRFAGQEFICKPQVGAGAMHAFRLSSKSSPEVLAQVLATYDQRPVMIQPFIEDIMKTGEHSLFYFNSQFSHCVLKTPKTGDFRVQEEHGGLLKAVIPHADLRQVAETALAAIPGMVLYARVDLVRLPDDTPAVIEVELIEPSLYFAFDQQSPERFADALAGMLK